MILAVDDAGWCPVHAGPPCFGRRRVRANAVLALIASATLLAVGVTQSSAAGLYRCIDGKGIVAYSAQPCIGLSTRPLAVDRATSVVDSEDNDAAINRGKTHAAGSSRAVNSESADPNIPAGKTHGARSSPEIRQRAPMRRPRAFSPALSGVRSNPPYPGYTAAPYAGYPATSEPGYSIAPDSGYPAAPDTRYPAPETRYPAAPLGAATPGSRGPLVVAPAGTEVVRPAPRPALAADPATGQILAPTGNQLVDPVTGTLWMRSGDHYVDPATGRSIPAR